MGENPETVDFYFRLFTTANASNDKWDAERPAYMVYNFTIPPDQLITAVEMGVYKDGEYDPVMRYPLSQHGDVRTLHTICRRFPDETIDRSE